MSTRKTKSVLVDKELNNLYVCRTCLATDVKLHNIFELHLEKLFGNIGIPVHPCDNFPRYICKACQYVLRISAEFQTRCQSAHNAFKELHEKGMLSNIEISKFNKKFDPCKQCCDDAMCLKTEKDTDSCENKTKTTEAHFLEIDFQKDFYNQTNHSVIPTSSIDLSYGMDIKQEPNDDIEITTSDEAFENALIEMEASETIDKIDLPNEVLNKNHKKPEIPAATMGQLKYDTEFNECLNEINILGSNLSGNTDGTVVSNRAYLLNKIIGLKNKPTETKDKRDIMKVPKERLAEKTPILRSLLNSEDVDIFMVPDSGSKKKYVVCKKIVTTNKESKTETVTMRTETKTSESLKKTSKSIKRGKNMLTCDICGQKIPPREFKQHQKDHMNNQPYICDYCGHEFRVKQLLQLHMTSLHIKRQPYKCDLCPKAYSQKSELQRHKRAHGTQPKPFVCSMCNKSYYSHYSRKIHVETVHLGLRNRRQNTIIPNI